MTPDPLMLCGIAVHWQDPEGAEQLDRAWPEDPRFELIVVNNSPATALDLERAKVIDPGDNLGFAGAINLGLRQTRAPLILLLNTDAQPEPRALDEILRGFSSCPDAAGIVPKLLHQEGDSQTEWQLQKLPTSTQLMLQTLMIPTRRGSAEEPVAGAPVEQPAAAAVAVRREILEEIGGLDEDFYPAWFEDVDLAWRLRERKKALVYWPSSLFVHGLGTSIPSLGYGRFLWVYYRNLCLYLRKHHGRFPALAARALLVPTALLRLVALPIRKPKRAPSRRQAAAGLLTLCAGSLSGWTLPDSYAAFADRSPNPRDGTR